MPDQTVKVSFTAPDTFTFDPPTVTMTAAGKIIFHREPGNADWTFVSVDDLPSPEYVSAPTGSGSGAEVTDKHTANGPSHYGVTVHDGSGNHPSGRSRQQTMPPMIVNQ